MKFFKNFLLLLPIVLGSASQRPSEMSGNRIVHDNKANGSQAVLIYIGSMSGKFHYDLAIDVLIDTSIGIRYDLTILKTDSATIGHVAIFYKFSNPYQSTTYNFLRHESTLNKYGGPPSSDPKVVIIGAETVNTYTCTHLQNSEGKKGISDYWMCPSVPGFSKLVNTLKTISPGLPALAFSGTIFNWGGLVRMTKNFVSQNGQAENMELHLQEANTDIVLPSKTFEVPSK